MNKRNRSLGISFLLLLYAAFSALSSFHTPPFYRTAQAVAEDGGNIVLPKSSFLFSTPETALADSPKTLPFGGPHNHFAAFSSFFFREGFYETTGKNYLCRTTDLVIRFRKSDLIFPFHYHW